MPTTVLYRLSSGEVLKISERGQSFSDADPLYLSILIDPAFPDGTDVREERADGTLGPLRVLGFAKFADVPGAIVRNATQPEIDTFAPLEEADTDLQDTARAADLGDIHPHFRRMVKAVLRDVVEEANQNAFRYNELRGQLIDSVSFPDLRARLLGDTSTVPLRSTEDAFGKTRGNTRSTD